MQVTRSHIPKCAARPRFEQRDTRPEDIAIKLVNLVKLTLDVLPDWSANEYTQKTNFDIE